MTAERRWRPVLWLALWLPVFGGLFWTGGSSALGQTSLESLPAQIRQTLVSKLEGARLVDAMLTNENGHQIYELEVRQKGLLRNVTIGADGDLLARQVFLDELPAAVRTTLKRETVGKSVSEIYWINEEGAPAYYTEFPDKQQKRALNIAPDGWLNSRQMFWTETPVEVQNGIRDKMVGIMIQSIDLAEDNDGKTYEVLERNHGREHLWIFEPTGELVAEPVSQKSVPPAALQVLTKKADGGRQVRILKFKHADKMLYEMTWVRGEERYTCAVDADGQVVSDEMPLSALPEVVRKTVAEKTNGRYLVRIEKQPPGDGGGYEVTTRQQGKTETLLFPPDGRLPKE
ncbi:MAG: hypothetical protein WCO56_15700 [Verrucomicrobiota bacterium]